MQKLLGAEIRVRQDRCPYCHEGVGPEEVKTACGTCMAWHHEECWVGHSGCSGCGLRDPEQRAPREERASETEGEDPNRVREYVLGGLGVLCSLVATLLSLATMSVNAHLGPLLGLPFAVVGGGLALGRLRHARGLGYAGLGTSAVYWILGATLFLLN